MIVHYLNYKSHDDGRSCEEIGIARTVPNMEIWNNVTSSYADFYLLDLPRK